jgi:lysozyme family protein
MADFSIFLPIVLKFEGGFADDPADPGGATNLGITFKTFSGCAEKILNVQPTLETLRSLTDNQAGAIYQALYWNAVQGDDMPLQDLANIVCDFYVNAGGHATKLLQQVMNECGCAIVVDGDIGPASVRALAALDQTEVYRRYKAGRIAYYQNLVADQPGLSKFLDGWLNRVKSFPDL